MISAITKAIIRVFHIVSSVNIQSVIESLDEF